MLFVRAQKVKDLKNILSHFLHLKPIQPADLI